jgi:hypothetical protein
VTARGAGTCPSCGAGLAPGSRVCPGCGTPVADPGPTGASAASEPRDGSDPRRRGAAVENPFASELNRRLARLAQWSEAADALGVELPRLPGWAEEAAARSRSPEPWAEVVRGVERLAQRRIAEAFERWEERTNARIARLEAYSVDSRLEHSQVEDAVHAAKLGDLAQALATFHQVDRVVTLKERHLDQARDDLERLLGFLRDLEGLGLVDPGEPTEVAKELERELRTGRLASLKQRLRLLRSRAVERVTETLPDFVAQFGDQLAADRRTGPDGDAAARELAVATRSVVLGRPEDGVHRLRALKEATGLAVPKVARGAAGGG